MGETTTRYPAHFSAVLTEQDCRPASVEGGKKSCPKTASVPGIAGFLPPPPLFFFRSGVSSGDDAPWADRSIY
jgi:hypothetical protein